MEGILWARGSPHKGGMLSLKTLQGEGGEREGHPTSTKNGSWVG